MSNSALRALTDWADRNSVKLDSCKLELHTTPTVEQSDWDPVKSESVRKLVPRTRYNIDLSFAFKEETPLNLRALKRACGGKLTPTGYAPYVGLKATVDLDAAIIGHEGPTSLFLNVRLEGAFDCEYTCKAAAHPGMLSELSDGSLTEAMREDEIKSALASS